MTSQPLQLLLVLMLMFTLSSAKATEHNGIGNVQQQQPQPQPHHQRLQHHRSASEISQEYVEQTTTMHNRRHQQHHHHHQNNHQQNRHEQNESTTNYHQHQDIRHNDINNVNNSATTAMEDFRIKSNHHNQSAHQQQQQHQHKRLSNTRDRHTEPTQVDVSNKRHHHHRQQQQQQHMTTTTTTTTAATTTTAPQREDLLHLTLNAANEDNDRIGNNDIVFKRKHNKHNNNHDHDDDEDVAGVAAANADADNDDDENYYDDFDYMVDDVAAAAPADDDDDDDAARRQTHGKKLKSHNVNMNYNRAKAAAARRVPRDHRYVGSSSWNANNIDNSQDEMDYLGDDSGYQLRTGDITAQKLNELGTESRVKEAFKTSQLREQVRLHQERVAKEGACSVPKPQIEYVKQHTSEQFFPRGTILHRCNPSTGCCLLSYKVCGPKTTENVTLAFEVQHGYNTHKEIRLIQFVNHTECKCDHPLAFSSDLQRRKRSHVATFKINTPRPREIRHQATCQCPNHFERIIKSTEHEYEADDYDYDNDANSLTSSTSTTECSCDCHSDNLVCQRLKNGEEGFAVFDRKCISSNECTVPTCSHGTYNPQVGRCPHAQSTTSTTNTACHNRHGCHRNYG